MGKPGPDGEAAMHALSRLTSEQRDQVWRAVMAVINLPPEKRLELISTEEERRKMAREQCEQARKDIGVPQEGLRAFYHKYFEERRAIELELRKEMDEHRKVKVAELNERMKKEYATAPAPDNQKAVVPPK